MIGREWGSTNWTQNYKTKTKFWKSYLDCDPRQALTTLSSKTIQTGWEVVRKSKASVTWHREQPFDTECFLHNTHLPTEMTKVARVDQSMACNRHRRKPGVIWSALSRRQGGVKGKQVLSGWAQSEHSSFNSSNPVPPIVQCRKLKRRNENWERRICN